MNNILIVGVCGVLDKDICLDLLMIEKYVFGIYDIVIFEFKDIEVCDVLNYI